MGVFENMAKSGFNVKLEAEKIRDVVNMTLEIVTWIKSSYGDAAKISVYEIEE